MAKHNQAVLRARHTPAQHPPPSEPKHHPTVPPLSAPSSRNVNCPALSLAVPPPPPTPVLCHPPPCWPIPPCRPIHRPCTSPLGLHHISSPRLHPQPHLPASITPRLATSSPTPTITPPCYVITSPPSTHQSPRLTTCTARQGRPRLQHQLINTPSAPTNHEHLPPHHPTIFCLVRCGVCAACGSAVWATQCSELPHSRRLAPLCRLPHYRRLAAPCLTCCPCCHAGSQRGQPPYPPCPATSACHPLSLTSLTSRPRSASHPTLPACS